MPKTTDTRNQHIGLVTFAGNFRADFDPFSGMIRRVDQTDLVRPDRNKFYRKEELAGQISDAGERPGIAKPLDQQIGFEPLGGSQFRTSHLPLKQARTDAL